jgi:hypothetical protein
MLHTQIIIKLKFSKRLHQPCQNANQSRLWQPIRPIEESATVPQVSARSVGLRSGNFLSPRPIAPVFCANLRRPIFNLRILVAETRFESTEDGFKARTGRLRRYDSGFLDGRDSVMVAGVRPSRLATLKKWH